MVTMRDVARVAQVSATTVSHVINKTRKVDPETERAVLEAIEATGYLSDGIGRSLRTGTTQTIGLAMSAISNPYFGTVVHAIERSISRAGYSLLLADTHDDPVRERRAVRDLLSHRVDAMVIAPSGEADSVLDALVQRRIPVVLIDRIPTRERPGVDAIGVVNEEPTARLVDHLAQIGHSRIATITSDPMLETTIERLSGYWNGIERNGLTRDEDLVQVGVRGSEETTDDAVATLLGLPEPPTAIVMGNNQVTIGTMAALQHHHMEAPRDMALVAFDDFPWANIFRPRLTAVSQPVDELGAGAVSMLLDRLADRDLPPRHRRLEPTLKHRESCGCTGLSTGT
ncbi:LacI family DNA-binding transcriptional regulator [Isoptericola sp. b441]|uniref:LacI family DNA-binding transcriptional regulator n=1 Tax=Actinotalea lenta TaxID=3064654 RepID=A0ABT9D7F3_9CELL|nr:MULTISPECIES: LacI family DNA-binding transcriptional regulator [unclassified Isoptericola]MDO8106149.1 LacI family DNA-binding transcriptional regulator [Isoptericola sp. b441]MDO8122132.1 LacI family DNA-binding transcriptional regulator [Isoptericola sp. b490]